MDRNAPGNAVPSEKIPTLTVDHARENADEGQVGAKISSMPATTSQTTASLKTVVEPPSCDPSPLFSAFATNLNVSTSSSQSFALGTTNSHSATVGRGRNTRKSRGVRGSGSSSTGGVATRTQSPDLSKYDFVFEPTVNRFVFSHNNDWSAGALRGVSRTSVLNTKPTKPAAVGSSCRAKVSDTEPKKEDSSVHSLATFGFLTSAFPNQPPPPNNNMPLVEIVQYYLSLSSEPKTAASQTDWNGRTPLHHAAALSQSVDPDVILLLLQVFPEAAAQLDRLGELPLQTFLYSIVQHHEAKKTGVERRRARMYQRSRWSKDQKSDDDDCEKEEMPKMVATLEVVKAFLDANPAPAIEPCWRDASTQRTSMLLLQFLCLHLDVCEPGVFEFVFDLHPEAAHRQDRNGQTALHHLATSSSTSSETALSALESLLGHSEFNAEAMASTQDSRGKTPFALATQACGSVTCGRFCSQLVQRLLKISPEAAKELDDNGRLPIEIILGAFRDDRSTRMLRQGGYEDEDHLQADLVRALLAAHPKRAQVVHPATRETLLHLAVARRPCCHADVVNVLCEAHPTAVIYRDEARKQTPLHRFLEEVVSSNGALVRTVEREEQVLSKMEILLQKVVPKKEVVTEDKDDENNKNSNKCEQQTTAAAIKDRDDVTPLHIVAADFVDKRTNVSDGTEGTVRHLRLHSKMIKMLVEACPGAAGEFNRWGRLPLHVAVLSTPSVDCLQLLLQAYPKAAETTDKQENTPLHLLLSKAFDRKDIFDCLFEAYPDAAITQDGKGKTPLMLLPGWEPAPRGSDKEEVARHVFNSILDRHDGVVSLKTKEDHGPLYGVLCREEWRGPILDRVIDAYSNAEDAMIQDLSKALLKGLKHRNNELCDYIAKRWPSAVRSTSGDNQTALHEVRELDALKSLLRAWPEAVFQRSEMHGMTPVHCWMWQLASSDVAAALHEVRQTVGDLSVAKVADNHGMFPFHYACAHFSRTHHKLSRSVESTFNAEHGRLLLEAHPEAVVMSTGTSRHWNPHISPLYGTKQSTGKSIVALLFQDIVDGPSVIERLLFDHLKAPPARTTTTLVTTTTTTTGIGQGEGGSSPTTDVANKNQHDEVESLQDDDERKAAWIVHQVCANSSKFDDIVSVIDMCRDRFPTCVRTRFGKEGRLPLHTSCTQSECSLRLVKRLTDLYGAALTVEDQNGVVPFVLACLCGASMDVLYHLLRSAPDVLLVTK